MTTVAHRAKRAPSKAVSRKDTTYTTHRTHESHSPSQNQSTATSAVRAALGTDACECGRPIQRVALFYQLTPECSHRHMRALAICKWCATDFTDAEKILTMEEAYELANIPLPQTSQP